MTEREREAEGEGRRGRQGIRRARATEGTGWRRETGGQKGLSFPTSVIGNPWDRVGERDRGTEEDRERMTGGSRGLIPDIGS